MGNVTTGATEARCDAGHAPSVMASAVNREATPSALAPMSARRAQSGERRYPDELGNELGELGAQPNDGDEEEYVALEEDGGERGAVQEPAKAMEQTLFAPSPSPSTVAAASSTPTTAPGPLSLLPSPLPRVGATNAYLNPRLAAAASITAHPRARRAAPHAPVACALDEREREIRKR